MPNLDLPVEGYQQEPIADPNGYALPVDYTAGGVPIGPNGLPRVTIDTSPKEPVLKEVEHDPWATGKEAIMKLFGGVESVNNLAKRFTNYDRQFTEDVLNLPKTIYNNSQKANEVGQKLISGDNWPMKLAESALTAPHDALTGKINPYDVDPVTGELKTSSQMIERALDMSALAGTGGLAGAGEGTALGSAPMLRPALKYKDKIYKAPVNGQHMDAIPPALYDEFQKMAMSGEDISHYNFGFMNHKGQFLDREKALDYAVKEGLVDPSAGQYGALTSTLLADSSKPGTAIEAMKTASPFYSALEHNVGQIKQGKMTGDQWLGTLANKPGVKPEELDWTGLKSFLEENKGKPVTKGQIEQHLAENKIEVGETVKGKTVDENSKEFNSLVENIMKNEKPSGGLSAAQDLAYDRLGGQKAKYSQYQLPGGENYRETLLTLPEKKLEISKDELNSAAQYFHKKNYDGLTTSEQKQVRDMAAVGSDNRPSNYKSSHWDEPNILAHVRMNDRTFPAPSETIGETVKRVTGKDYVDFSPEEQMKFLNKNWLAANKLDSKPIKSLHLEEIQSDWHQQGRKSGYKTGLTPDETAERHSIYSLPEKVRTAEQQKRMEELDAKVPVSGVPDAPFKKNWHELALKKAIREAAENGYDRLSWTAGEHHPTNPKNLNQTGPEADAADKGMQGFYNNIVPKSVEKLTGQKVKQGEIKYGGNEHGNKYGVELGDDKRYHITSPDGRTGQSYATRQEAQHQMRTLMQDATTKKIHYIDISQSLRDTAMGTGFPLFAKGVPLPLMPVDHDPFEKKK